MVQSIIMYASSIWTNATRVERHRNRLLGVQRKMALRVASAYRTASTEAVLVIAGMIPLDLRIEERVRIIRGAGNENETSRREREKTMENWQTRWDCSLDEDTDTRGRDLDEHKIWGNKLPTDTTPNQGTKTLRVFYKE